MSPTRIVIIGGGFSGTVLAYHLHRYTRSPLTVTIVEKNKELLEGASYSNPYFSHLLNMPAGKMSISDDVPEDFAYWLDNNKHKLKGMLKTGLIQDQYVPRRYFEEYLSYVQSTLQSQSSVDFKLEIEFAEVEDIVHEKTGCRCQLSTGQTLEFDHVILATGNPIPLPLTIKNLPKTDVPYLADPTDMSAIARINKNDNVTIIGSGLSMMDVIVSLAANGHVGEIQVISNQGFLNKTKNPLKKTIVDGHNKVLVKIYHTIQKVFHEKDLTFSNLIDEMAPHLKLLWQDLSFAEKKIFLHYIRTFWESYRSKAAPHLFPLLKAMLQRKQLLIQVGRIVEINFNKENFTIQYKSKEDLDTTQTTYADRLINCTGVTNEYDVVQDVLMKHLIERGYIQLDRLGLSLTRHGEVVNQNGKAQSFLSAVGATTKGTLFDIITVPDTRAQCKVIAERITSTK